MTEVRAEISLKFSTILQVRDIPNGWIELDLTAPNSVVFTVNIKRKLWKKSEAPMRELGHWVASVRGKLGNPTPSGFELEGAGIQV